MTRDLRFAAGALRMPAEWEPHRATWIGWPHHEPDWPGKFASIPWVYAEIARVLAEHEPLEILCAFARGAHIRARNPRSARRPSGANQAPHRSHRPRMAARLGAHRRDRCVRRRRPRRLALQRLGQVRQLAVRQRGRRRDGADHGASSGRRPTVKTAAARLSSKAAASMSTGRVCCS